MSVRVFAPAKINLTLKVGRPRADGLHPLESMVAFADIGDIVTAESGDDLALTIEGDFARDLAADDENLVLRAARALAQAAGVAAHARLTLEKNLPVASGVGGGSADAAAALRALNQLWALNWDGARLAKLGRTLGADVPVFFTSAGAAFMSGTGEVCSPAVAPPLAAVLVNPLAPLATADVYRQFDRMSLGGALAGAGAPRWDSADAAIAGMRALGNDLEAPAQALMPAIAAMLAELRALPQVRHAALSGSGATVFALTDDWNGAETLATELIARHPDWWVSEAMLGA